NVLPWREEILKSLLACDVVGFHIPRYVNNFVSAARSLLETSVVARERVREDMSSRATALSEQTVPTTLEFEGRTIALQASPVGVDVDYIEAIAQKPETATRAAEIREELGDAKLLLSVGRTDYTKGGIEQLESYERLIEGNPELRGTVRLMHVSVPANRNMTVYENIQNDLEQIAGRINGRFGRLDWQPVTLISRPLPFESLVAYYQAADIAWITPLADGMNLVAKEFCAARVDGDGVLVLSEFAGAAVQLDSAILTNPFSNRSMDHAVLQALSMGEDERRHRMGALREMVARQDVRFWAEDQMTALALEHDPVVTMAAAG
ncbi:MAG: alpha,alpha-trehalose-phosphate synthase (UDP-forming), partial [Rhizobiaceae bacterium]